MVSITNDWPQISVEPSISQRSTTYKILGAYSQYLDYLLYVENKLNLGKRNQVIVDNILEHI